MATDFNLTAVLDDVINNPMETTAGITGELATEGNALSGLLIFAFFLLLILIVLAVLYGGLMAIFKLK